MCSDKKLTSKNDSKFTELYKQLLNLQDAEFIKIEHDDSIVAIVYKVIMPDGSNLILKICDQAQHFHKELYFLNYFADKLPVAKVVNLVVPANKVHGAILMQCLPGNVLQANGLTTDLAFVIGGLLAKIHINKTTAFGDLPEPSSMVADPRIYFAAKFEESFAECMGHLSDSLLKKCRRCYEQNIDLLLKADGPCIIHRDFRPGNILVHNNQLSGVIDWASGRAGFAEDDLCQLEMGEWGDDLEIKTAFLNGYTSIRPLPNYTVMLPLLLLNRAIAVIGFTVKIGTYNSRDSAFYNRNLNIMTRLLN